MIIVDIDSNILNTTVIFIVQQLGVRCSKVLHSIICTIVVIVSQSCRENIYNTYTLYIIVWWSIVSFNLGVL